MTYDINVLRIVRQKKGDYQYIERHSHDFFHYIYILNGEGQVVVEDRNYEVKKQDLMLIPPKTPHEVYGKKDLISMDIKFSCGGEFSLLLSSLPDNIPSLGREEDRLLKTIFEEALNKDDYFEDIINLRVLEFLFVILRKSGKKAGTAGEFPCYSGTESRRAKEISPALTYIEQNLSKPVRVCDVADFMGFSVAYFSTFFKEIMGQSPITYINSRKCEKAKELMFYSNLNITQIADKLGYESIHYFSRVFKKNVGVSPRDFFNRGEIDVVIHVKEDESMMKKTGYEIPIRNIQDHSIEEKMPYEV